MRAETDTLGIEASTWLARSSSVERGTKDCSIIWFDVGGVYG
jgi:hypothetical protein